MSVLHVDNLLLGLGDALVVTDVQNDFLPGGALAISDGDRVLAPLNHAIRRFRERGLPIIATRDWHPPDHMSFYARAGPWPPHCVQNSLGAMFSPLLELPRDAQVISKAFDPDLEAYSAFDGTSLESHLRRQDVHHIFLGGLATDYCVLLSTRDALALGFSVSVLVDAICGIDVLPGDSERALATMLAEGATLVSAGPIGPPVREVRHVSTP